MCRNRFIIYSSMNMSNTTVCTHVNHGQPKYTKILAEETPTCRAVSAQSASLHSSSRSTSWVKAKPTWEKLRENSSHPPYFFWHSHGYVCPPKSVTKFLTSTVSGCFWMFDISLFFSGCINWFYSTWSFHSVLACFRYSGKTVKTWSFCRLLYPYVI